MFLIDLFVISFGLGLGSFLNILSINLLNHKSILAPAVRCLNCRFPVAPHELVSLWSYITRRGKCGICKGRISPLHPIAEVGTAFAVYVLYRQIGFAIELLPAGLLLITLVVAVLTDLRAKLILDKITLPAILLLGLTRLFIGEKPFWFYLLGACVGFFLLLFIAVLSKGGLGGGDIKLYAAIGFVLGPWLTLMSFLLASVFGAIIGLLFIFQGKKNRKESIAFGPFIAIGTLISYLYGLSLWEWFFFK